MPTSPEIGAKKDSHIDPMNSKSRLGWIVHFAGAPITWASKMQTITALSTTEAEYIALSTSFRDVIPMMGILKEARKQGLQVDYLPPRIHCTVSKTTAVFWSSPVSQKFATNKAHQPVISSFS